MKPQSEIEMTPHILKSVIQVSFLFSPPVERKQFSFNISVGSSVFGTPTINFLPVFALISALQP